VARLSPLRVLLVEADFGDREFLREALEEAAALRLWPGDPGVRITPVLSLEDACDFAFDGAFDVIVFHASLPDSPVAHESFSRLASVAPSCPLIALTEADDPFTAAQLLRQGAQDVLVKSHIDAAPLGIAIRNAVERQRFVNALRSATRPDAPAALPSVSPFIPPDEDGLLAMIEVTGVSSDAPELRAAMLSD